MENRALLVSVISLEVEEKYPITKELFLGKSFGITRWFIPRFCLDNFISGDKLKEYFTDPDALRACSISIFPTRIADGQIEVMLTGFVPKLSVVQ